MSCHCLLKYLITAAGALALNLEYTSLYFPSLVQYIMPSVRVWQGHGGGGGGGGGQALGGVARPHKVLQGSVLDQDCRPRNLSNPQ